MGLEGAFRELAVLVRQLYDMMLALRLTVAEDKPVKGELSLVGHLEDAILDLMGRLDECHKAASAAQRAAGHPTDLDQARRGLASCQDEFHQVESVYADRLASYEKFRDLARVSHEHRGEWIPWARSVKDGIEQCRQPLDAVRKTMAGCWLELAERSGNTHVSVRTSNIGQKIIARGVPDDIAVEGLT
jgi:hypothetical protein